jgi:hypothetical protein
LAAPPEVSAVRPRWLVRACERAAQSHCPKFPQPDRRDIPIDPPYAAASLLDFDHASSGDPRERFRDCSSVHLDSAENRCEPVGGSRLADSMPRFGYPRAAAIDRCGSATTHPNSVAPPAEPDVRPIQDVLQGVAQGDWRLRPDHRSRRSARSNSQKIPNLARTGPLTWLRARTTSSTLAPVRRGAATAHLVDLPVDVLWPVGRIIARAEKRLILS